jgi:hypothetical protein
MTLRLRRGTDLQRQSITFSEGELVYVTDTGELYVGDGSTVGGNLIVGGGAGSSLTSNLNLSGYEINGTGNIAINGTVSALAIDSGIVSVDSTLIVDNVNSAFYGSFIGDGSLITNISLGDLNDFNLGTLNPGDVVSWNGTEWTNTPVLGASSTFVGDVVGSVFRDDSTPLLDAIDGVLQGSIRANDGSLVFDADAKTIVTSSIQTAAILTIQNITDGQPLEVYVDAFDELPQLKLRRSSDSDLSGVNDSFGIISFHRNDIVNNDVNVAYITAGNNAIYLGVDGAGSFTETNTLTWTQEGRLGIGSYLPATALEIKNGSLRFFDNRTYTSIASPVSGEMIYDTTTTDGGLYIYNNTEWTRAVVEQLDAGATVLSTFLQLGSSDTSSRDGYGTDSNSNDGAMFYNIDAERIQYYQADSWFSMPNQSLEEDADVRFASVTANTFISTGGGAPTLESETVIDLQAAERVRVTTSPFRLAQLTTTERNAISPVAGDLIYNTTDNRFQGYQNGGWINLDDGTSA